MSLRWSSPLQRRVTAACICLLSPGNERSTSEFRALALLQVTTYAICDLKKLVLQQVAFHARAARRTSTQEAYQRRRWRAWCLRGLPSAQLCCYHAPNKQNSGSGTSRRSKTKSGKKQSAVEKTKKSKVFTAATSSGRVNIWQLVACTMRRDIQQQAK